MRTKLTRDVRDAPSRNLLLGSCLPIGGDPPKAVYPLDHDLGQSAHLPGTWRRALTVTPRSARASLGGVADLIASHPHLIGGGDRSRGTHSSRSASRRQRMNARRSLTSDKSKSAASQTIRLEGVVCGGEKVADVEWGGIHVHAVAPVGGPWPLIGRPIPVELESVSIRVGQV